MSANANNFKGIAFVVLFLFMLALIVAVVFFIRLTAWWMDLVAIFAFFSISWIAKIIFKDPTNKEKEKGASSTQGENKN